MTGTTRPSARAVASTVVAAAVLAGAATAQAAVRQSTYAVTKIEQTSSLDAALGSSTWSARSSFTYTAPVSANRVAFDYPTRLTFDAFTKGGTNPRYGVLQGVYPQRRAQSGTVTYSQGTCTFPADVPRDESELSVRFFRTGRTARTVYVEVSGPDAIRRIDDDGARVECLRYMPSLGTASPQIARGDAQEVSFAVPRNRFRKAFTGRRTKLVLSGTARSTITANGNRAGTMTVTTKVTMQLVGSR